MERWPSLRRLSLSLLLLLSVVFVAVSCGEKEDNRAEPVAMEEVVADNSDPEHDSRMQDLEAIREEIRRMQFTGNTPEQPANPVDATSRLEEYSKDMNLENQHKRITSINLYRDGLAAESNSDVDKARGLFKSAWETDPTNIEAEKKYWEMMAIIDQDRYGDIRTDWERMQDTRSAQLQLIRLQLRNDYEAGVKLYDKGKFSEAIKKFNSVFDRIEFSPLEIDVEGYRDRANEYLKSAKAKKLIQEAEEKKRIQEQALNLAEAKTDEERARRAQKVQKWLMEARNAFEMEKYQTVEQKCRLILQADPGNTEATVLLDAAEVAVLEFVDEKIRKQHIRAWQNQLIEFQELLTPWWDPDNIIFPAQEFNKPVNETGLGIYLGGDGGGSGGGDAARRILAETQLENLDFQQRSLVDLISLLQDRTGINMVMDNDYADIATAPVINLKVRDVSAERVFKILNDMYGVSYDVMPQKEDSYARPTIFVTKNSLTGGERIIHRHYVADILNPINDYPATDIMFGNTTVSSFAQETEVGVEPVKHNAREDRAREFISLIKASVEPKSWTQKNQYNETPVIRVTDDGYLMVKHTRRVQQAISNMTGDMRRVNGVMVSLETAFITITDDLLNLLTNTLAFDDSRDGDPTSGGGGGGDGGTSGGGGGDGFGNNDGDAGAFFHELNPERRVGTDLGTDLTNTGGTTATFQFLGDFELQYTFAMVKKDQRSKAVTAPRLTLFNSQRANVALVNSRNYIQDYDVQVATGTSIFDPVIGHVDSGVVLDVRPTVSHDMRYIDLEIHTTLSSIAPNMRTLPAAVGGPNAPVIELPELDVQSISSTLRIPDGGTLMIGGNRTITDSNTESNVPFLEKIPVLSFFFGSKQKNLFQSSTMILVRAKVIVLDEALERQTGEQR